MDFRTALAMVIRGDTYIPEWDADRLQTQQIRVLNVMHDGEWRTLSEIQHAIQAACGRHDSEAAISARLRDFRKVGLEVERRRRDDPTRGLHEYRVIIQRRMQ